MAASKSTRTTSTPAARATVNPDTIRAAFSRRLNELCDAAGVAKKRRDIAVGKMFGSKPTVAQKWLTGAAMPTPWGKFASVAIRFNVEAEWLATGRGQQRRDSPIH